MGSLQNCARQIELVTLNMIFSVVFEFSILLSSSLPSSGNLLEPYCVLGYVGIRVICKAKHMKPWV